MTEDQMREALGVLGRPQAPDRGFADDLFETLLRETERRPRRLRPAPVPRPGAPRLRRLVVIAAALGITLLSWLIVRPLVDLGAAPEPLEAPDTPSEIGPFPDVPPFEAGVDIGHPFAPETSLVLTYRDPSAWRIDVLSGSGSGTLDLLGPGSFYVWDGKLVHVYDASSGQTYESGTRDPAFSPLQMLWWDDPQAPWGEACREGDVLGVDTQASRPTYLLSCDMPNDETLYGGGFEGKVELSVDAETGLILRIVSTGFTGDLEDEESAMLQVGPLRVYPNSTLEVTSLATDVEVSDDDMQFTPPPDAEPLGGPGNPPELSFGLGDVAPAATGQTLDGSTVTPESWRGRATAVYLWATWCPPCVGPTLDEVNAASAARGSELSVVAVAVTDDRPRVLAFVAERAYTVSVVISRGEEGLGEAWGVQGIPALILLDADGRLVAAYQGDLDADDIAAILGAFAAGEVPPDVGGNTQELLPE